MSNNFHFYINLGKKFNVNVHHNPANAPINKDGKINLNIFALAPIIMPPANVENKICYILNFPNFKSLESQKLIITLEVNAKNVLLIHKYLFEGSNVNGICL